MKREKVQTGENEGKKSKEGEVDAGRFGKMKENER